MIYENFFKIIEKSIGDQKVYIIIESPLSWHLEINPFLPGKQEPAKNQPFQQSHRQFVHRILHVSY